MNKFSAISSWFAQLTLLLPFWHQNTAGILNNQTIMKFTYYGHACFGIEVQGKKLLFDPFIRFNELAKEVVVEAIEADYILVSHGHADHIADCVEIANRTHATVITNFEIHEWLQQQGVSNTQPMNTGGSITLPFGQLKAVVAQHSSKLPDGSNGGNPMGFVLRSVEGNLYYSGDTALTLDMQLIPRFAKIDTAILCIGDVFTMGPEDALEAAKMVGAKQVIGVHYDTFPPIKIDATNAHAIFAAAEIPLILPVINSTVNL